MAAIPMQSPHRPEPERGDVFRPYGMPEVRSAIRACRSLSDRAKLVWLALAERHGEDGECYPSAETIGADIGGVVERLVRRYLGELEKAGLIRRTPRMSAAGRQTSNVVEFLWRPVGPDQAGRFRFIDELSPVPGETHQATSSPDSTDRGEDVSTDRDGADSTDRGINTKELIQKEYTPYPLSSETVAQPETEPDPAPDRLFSIDLPPFDPPWEHELKSIAGRIHQRHPARKCSLKIVEQKLKSICKALPATERVKQLRNIDRRHEKWCRSVDWTKNDGEFVKGLEAWLNPARRLWENEPRETSKPQRPLEPVYEDATQYRQRIGAL